MDGVFQADVLTRALAGLACVLLAVIAFVVCGQARKRHAARLRELDRATSLMSLHAAALEGFLGSATAPAAMKRIIWSITRSVGERSVAMDMAQSVISQTPGLPGGFAAGWSADDEDEDVRDVVGAFERLRQDDPPAARLFGQAVVSGSFATILRWPESARLLRAHAPTVIVDDAQEVASAVRVSRRRDAAHDDRHAREAVTVAW